MHASPPLWCLPRRFVFISQTWLFTAGTTIAATLPDQADSEPKDFSVFIGLEVIANGEGRVRGVGGNSAEVIENGRILRVPLTEMRNIRTSREPVVSSMFVTISHDTGNRVYSGRNDPVVEAMQSQMMMDSLQADRHDRMVQAQVQSTEAAAATARADPVTRAGLARAEQIASARSDAALQNALVNHDLGQKALTNRGAPEEGRFDAFEVSFEITSADTIMHAYAALLTTIRDPQKPKTPVDFVMLRKLPPIDSTPKKIRLLQAGLPIGFGVDRYEIHVYSEGRELASNLSEKRIEVTRAEAFQFLLLRHTMSHVQETIPPLLIPDFLPPNIREFVSEDGLSRKVDVSINAEGSVVTVALDQDGTGTTDSRIESLIREARFLPALVEGKPIQGSTMLLLRDFIR